MKKLSISLLVMLLIASLFTSCSNGSDDASDVRVNVKITPSEGGRSLSAVTETINLDDNSITWHYSATKVSEKQFNYGATSDSILPKDGIVTLSQGEWSIGLWGIKDGKKVYAGTTSNVTIKWNFYEPNVTVPVPVKQSTGDNGYIVLTDVKIKVGESIITPNYASIDGVEITNLNGAYMKIECAPGTHSVTFAYKEGTSLFGKETISVKVESGLETKVIGYIDGTGSSGSSESQTTVMQPIEVKKAAEVKIESSIVPATTSTPGTKTTVTFPSGSFNDDSANAVINLGVKSAGGDFSIGNLGSSAPVAGIDISLLVNGNKVTSFNGKEVKIETYIATGLSNVGVKYLDPEHGLIDITGVITNSTNESNVPYYNSTTGKLIFSTPHFSEYYVLADEVEAYNTNQNKVYATLQDAINNVTSGDTVLLLKDVKLKTPTSTNCIQIKESMTLDGNGKKIYRNDSTIEDNARLVNITGISDKNITIKNITIESEKAGTRMRALNIYDLEKVNLSIENSVIQIPNFYAFYIGTGCTNTTISIDSSTIRGWATIYNHSSGVKLTANNSIFDSVNLTEGGGNTNSFGNIIVAEYYDTDGSGDSNNNIFEFNKCEFTANKEHKESDVKQVVFDVRSPYNNTLKINNCSFSNLATPEYIRVCYDTEWEDSEEKRGEMKGTNRLFIDDEEVDCSSKAYIEYYLDKKS